MIYDQTDYREILRSTLGQRQDRNPRYSLRAFARDLQVSPSRLSEVLSGGHQLSTATAREVASRLNLSGDEQGFFFDLVEAETAGDDQRRAAALARLEQARHAMASETLTLERFEMVSRWYYFAILELFKVKGFKPTAARIASRLGLAKNEAQRALGRLCRLGFLERHGPDKKLVVRKPRTTTNSAAPSEAVRGFHRQILEKAIDATYFQGIDERAFGSMVLAFDQRRLEEAERRLATFRAEFAAEFAPKAADSVYCLAVQLFRLDGGRPEDRPPPQDGKH